VMVMYGAPTVFHGLWMAVVPFIAEETRCAPCAALEQRSKPMMQLDDMC